MLPFGINELPHFQAEDPIQTPEGDRAWSGRSSARWRGILRSSGRNRVRVPVAEWGSRGPLEPKLIGSPSAGRRSACHAETGRTASESPSSFSLRSVRIDGTWVGAHKG